MSPKRLFSKSHAITGAAFALLLAATLFGGPVRAQTPSASATPTPTPTPALTDEQKKLVSAADDAVVKALAAVQLAEGARRAAADRAERIKALTEFEAADETSLRNIQALKEVVRGSGDFLKGEKDEDNPYLSELKSAGDALKAARDALPSEGQQPAQIGRARSDSDAVQKRLAAVTASFKETQNGLKGALGKAYDASARFVSLLSGQFDSLKLPAKDEKDVETLAGKLPRQTAGFRRMEFLRRVFDQEWKALSGALGEVVGNPHKAKADEIKTALAALHKKFNDTLPNFDAWFQALQAGVQRSSGDIVGKVPAVRSDPVRNSTLAADEARQGSELGGRLKEILSQWQELAVQLKNPPDIPGDASAFDVEKTSVTARSLETASRALGFAVTDLQDAVAGNFSNFEADQVSLYYFTDVPNLMKILNSATFEVNGATGAREQAALERRKLEAAESDLADARQSVSDLQSRLVLLRERLRQAEESRNSLTKLARISSLDLGEARRDQTRAQERYDRAKAASNAEKPETRAELDRSYAQLERDNGRVGDAEERDRQAEAERKEAEDNYARLKDEQAGLPKQIQDVESRLSAAQAAVARQRASARLLAQAEAEAFAQARDNRPFWYAPPVGSSTDPARRVALWAFNDSKTLFMRGKRADLDEVRQIIARFDTPAPQARMTLWTLELSSDASTSGFKRFNEGLEVINKDLSDSRAYIAASLSFLRDCINKKVNEVGSREAVSGKPGVAGAYKNYVARLQFYQPEILERLDLNEAFGPDATEDESQFARRTIPDPAGTTTLGEALMVLSLGRRGYREDIIDDFTRNLPARLRELGLDAPEREKPGDEGGRVGKFEDSRFASLRRALSLDGAGRAGGPEILTSAQLEILRALEALRYQYAVDETVRRVRRLVNLEDEITRAQGDVRKWDDTVKLRAGEVTRLDAAGDPDGVRIKKLEVARAEAARDAAGFTVEQAKAERDAVVRRLLVSLRRLKKMTGESFEEIIEASQKMARAGADDDGQSGDAGTARGRRDTDLQRLLGLNPLRTSAARVAAADQMLKEIIIAAEDDLDRQFVQPMLSGLRKQLLRKGIGVGVVQRTSVLATNRLQARVDPRASAQLTLGEETDVLQAAQQLAQLYFATQAGGALGALGALKALPRKPEGELYGLTTGSVFQVTPIFDPSGQALRFKFDHVESSQIREPDGTVNPQLPRIERHTVNTEVQISNMELREVSRFESNARLGLATRYSGGLPILNDIPVVRRVPLFGWFVRRGGKAAVTQESLIFGQTTMYPTIGDIMGLLRQDY